MSVRTPAEGTARASSPRPVSKDDAPEGPALPVAGAELRKTMDRLLQQQRQALDHFFDHVDRGAVADAAEALALVAERGGLVHWCGVGKSGLVSAKLAQQCVAIGVRSVALCPMDALHGDLGMVSRGDVVLLMSKSGESAELVNLVPFLRVKGAELVSVTCRQESTLSGLCDRSVVLPLLQEVCPFQLSPATSCGLFTVFGDTVCAALMTRLELTRHRYAENHPSGRIGRRLLLKVSDVMMKDNLPTCSVADPLVVVLTEMSKGCGGVMVLDHERRLIGLFSDGDVRRALQSHGGVSSDLTVPSLMTPRDTVRSTHAGDLAYAAMQQMEEGRPINFMPVLDGGDRLVGILRLHDCFRAGL